MKTILDVQATADPEAKLIYAAGLLEFALRNAIPHAASDVPVGVLLRKSNVFGRNHVQDIGTALHLRNQIAHPSTNAPPSEPSLLSASQILLLGVEAIIAKHPHADPDGQLQSGRKNHQTDSDRIRQSDKSAAIYIITSVGLGTLGYGVIVFVALAFLAALPTILERLLK